MAYKNKNKNKAHIQALHSKGWRADQTRMKKYRQLMSSLPGFLSTKEKEEILKRRGKI